LRNTLLGFCLSCVALVGSAETRFGRPIVKVHEPHNYQFIKLDDVQYPTLADAHYSVSCLVYRGTEHYYVEVNVKNNSNAAITLLPDFITFDKPGYSVYRGDTTMAAREAAMAGGVRFVPTQPPYVPPTYNTTINATATTYGNQTNVSGTATTTADNSGQAGANLGNAIGNAIAAHRFYKMQRTEIVFSHFLSSHTQTGMDTQLQPGQSRVIVAVFDQTKRKKKPFDINLKVGDDTFRFDYKE